VSTQCWGDEGDEGDENAKVVESSGKVWTQCGHNVGGDEGDEDDENAKVVDTVLRVGRTA
jgi:hypothetical protein